MKRTLDLLVAGAGLVVLSPFLAVLAILVRIALGSPFLVRQVRPRITGWAQVNGRNATTWEKRLATDVWYMDHQNFLLHACILVRTMRQVIPHDEISQPTTATMPEFMGRTHDETNSSDLVESELGRLGLGDEDRGEQV